MATHNLPPEVEVAIDEAVTELAKNARDADKSDIALNYAQAALAVSKARDAYRKPKDVEE